MFALTEISMMWRILNRRSRFTHPAVPSYAQTVITSEAPPPVRWLGLPKKISARAGAIAIQWGPVTVDRKPRASRAIAHAVVVADGLEEHIRGSIEIVEEICAP